MLKTSILTILASLLFISPAFASESSTIEIQAVDESGISFDDVAAVSADWSKGNSAIQNQMMGYYSDEAAQAVLEVMPELKNNKRALISLTMGLLIVNERKEINIQEVLVNISTHTHLVKKSKISIKEAVDAVMSMNI